MDSAGVFLRALLMLVLDIDRGVLDLWRRGTRVYVSVKLCINYFVYESVQPVGIVEE